METINFSDWSKLDLRIAEIKNVEEIENADKLFKLILDVGELGERVVYVVRWIMRNIALF